jgi:hypothetical protein
MFRTKTAVALVAAALVVAWPAHAGASTGWPWPVAGSVVLAYGRTYTGAQGKTCSHGGIDIGAQPGAGVGSCVSGQITFAGHVPAGEGAQTFAVTVLGADGLRVTCLPLRSISVRRGENVSAGQTLGILAESGDASSSQTHLHLGVRRGEAQLDPASFLGSDVPVEAHAPVGPAVPPAAKTVGPGLPVRSHATSSSARALPAGPGVPVRSASPAPTPGTATSLEQAIRGAAKTSSSVLANTPVLTRVPEIGATPVLNASRMIADVRSGQGWLSWLFARLVLIGIGGACVLPVLRGARDAGLAHSARLEVARRSAR